MRRAAKPAMLLAAVVAAWLVPPAQGSTVRVVDVGGRPQLQYVAAPGERNDLRLYVPYRVQNIALVQDAVTLTPGVGCRRSPVGRTTAECEIGTETLSFVRVDLGDRNDQVGYHVSAGTTNPFPDLILDGPGDDRVVLESPWTARAANGPGADRFFCYDACRVLTGPVPGVGSVSGSGDDQLLGSAGRDLLMGGRGNDRIYGRGQNDRLDGGPDDDRLFGNAGNDRLYGRAGDDTLFGGPGVDFLSGGPGMNRLFP
jgi:Ca2+-binding RTX toxin-like protein